MQHGIETIKKVYELKAQGVSTYRLEKITGASRDTINRWIREPEKFSPYLDEVALERAIAGDRKVYENLSHAERREFWARVAKKYRAEVEWAYALHGRNNEAKYLRFMCECLGMTETAFKRSIDRKYVV